MNFFDRHCRLAYLAMGCLLSFVPYVAGAQAPEGYYADASDLEGNALRAALHDLIVDHQVIPYSSNDFDVRDAIDILDENANDPATVRLMYSDAVARKDSWPGYNREHVWPQSLGASEHSPAHSDLHHIFACDANVNSARGNRAYDDCNGDCNSHPEAPETFYSQRGWEPPDDQKGDVARALFYMDLRYDGDRDDEPDLRLIEWGVAPGCDCMGRLSKLREWHALDPVDDRERARNDGVFELQNNRNPFVDHPEWVESIWGAAPVFIDPVLVTFDPTPSTPWINEFHYENEGPDLDEGLEIAGASGTNLRGWTVLLYNGRDGRIYQEVPLSGRIDDEGMGFGARWFPVPNMQNGDADGMALVNPAGNVIEFLSYEGVIRAADGPAAKADSTDVGVEETIQMRPGGSIQRIGKGARPENYRWTVAPASRGVLNMEQIILRTTRLPFVLPLPAFLR